MFVSFTMFTEALSLACQLRHMRKSMAVEGLNSAYLGVMGLSRFTRIFFWATMSSKWGQFWYLIVADTVHTLLTIWFMVRYRKISKSFEGESVLAFVG